MYHRTNAMILPSKHLSGSQALLTLSGEIMALLEVPLSVSETWEKFSHRTRHGRVSFDWFILAVDLLFLLGLVEYNQGVLRLTQAPEKP